MTLTHEAWETGINIEAEAQKPDVKPELLVPGEYIGIVKSVTPIFSQSGNPGYEFRFNCVSTPDSSTMTHGALYQRMWLSEKAQRLGIIPLCKAVGYLPTQGKFNPIDLTDRYLRVLVKYRKDQNGEISTWPEIDIFGWGEFHGMRPVEEDDIHYFKMIQLKSLVEELPAEAPAEAKNDLADIPF